MQAALILSSFGANYERIAIQPTRPESGRVTSFIIFCRHYCTLCWVRSDPIVIWLAYKESDFVNQQGFIFFNGLISYTIYGIISGVLCFILIGFPLLLAVFILAIWGPIRAALAARDGRFHEYPLVIKFLRTN